MVLLGFQEGVRTKLRIPLFMGVYANRKISTNDLISVYNYRLVLTEIEKHEDGWPFLKPVNFKQFPTYKKYIKNPMDYTTIKNKLRDNL
jgi:hypothetical protein